MKSVACFCHLCGAQSAHETGEWMRQGPHAPKLGIYACESCGTRIALMHHVSVCEPDATCPKRDRRTHEVRGVPYYDRDALAVKVLAVTGTP